MDADFRIVGEPGWTRIAGGPGVGPQSTTLVVDTEPDGYATCCTLALQSEECGPGLVDTIAEIGMELTLEELDDLIFNLTNLRKVVAPDFPECTDCLNSYNRSYMQDGLCENCAGAHQILAEMDAA